MATDQTQIRRFNRLCVVASTAWLTLIVLVSLIFRPTFQDFSAFYMGGLLASQGKWDLLYPVPDPASPYYVGVDGTIKPGHQALADQHHVQQLCPFLQPPWNAMAFIPLGVLPFRVAHAIWWGLLLLGVFACAWVASKMYEQCVGRVTRASGLIFVLATCSPLAYRSIRVGNVSALLAGLMGLSLWWMLVSSQSKSTGKPQIFAGIALWVAGILKYASAALGPLLLATRRWYTIASLALLGGIMAAVTVAITGVEPFKEFFHAVGSGLDGSTLNPGNQSIYGALLRMRGYGPLPSSVITTIHTIQWIMLGVLVILTFRLPVKAWSKAPILLAGATAWLGWLLIFAPLNWEHYQMYLMPMWGWLIWEGMKNRFVLVIVVMSIAMAALPLQVVRWIKLPEPINSYLVLSTLMMVGIAIFRLIRANEIETSQSQKSPDFSV